MNILYVTNLPSPYRIDYFNELSSYCDVTVLYERKTASNRNQKWINESERRFTEIYADLKAYSTERSKGFDLIKKIKKINFDILVICGYSSPAVIALILYCIIHRIKYCIETDGGYNRKDEFPLNVLKKILINNSNAIITTCDELITYFRNIGYKKEIFKCPFTSVKENEIFQSSVSSDDKKKIKKSLHIEEENVVITIGRLDFSDGKGKGFDIFVKAACKLKNKNIGWYIIGGKPTQPFQEFLDSYCLSNVHIIDFQEKSNLINYYKSADIFVLMTTYEPWGLVINEAMACGLPVIASDRCISASEMVKNGINGYIVPVGDFDELASKTELILSDRTIIEGMSAANLAVSKEYTIEKMALSHYENFKKIYDKGLI